MDQRDDQKVVQPNEGVKSAEGSCKTSGSPSLPAKREPIFRAPPGSRQSPEPTAASVKQELPLKSEPFDANAPVPDAKLSVVKEGPSTQSKSTSADKDNNNEEVDLLQPSNSHAPERTSNGDSEEGEEEDEFCDDDELENPISRPKRSRTAYTAYQLDQLEWVFSQTHYPDVLIRQELSTRLGIAETKLQIWFQNRRARWRKQQRTGCVSSRSRNRKRQGAAPTVSSFPMGMALPHVSPWMLQAANLHGSSNGPAVCRESNPPGFFYNVANTSTVTNCSPLPLSPTTMSSVLPSIASLNGPPSSCHPYAPQGVVPTPPLPPAPGQLPSAYPQLVPIPLMTLPPSQALNEPTPVYNATFQTVEH